jgi:geranylgeranyl diphosphate synthase type II
MVHAFSLVHDDLPAIDDDPIRRGRPAVHVEFGEAIAILAGDALFALAFRTIAQSAAKPEVVSMAVETLARAAGSEGLVGGEVLDVLAEGPAPARADVREIHLRKTASLIGASCEIGALFGGGTRFQVDKLSEFGREVGLAFQIIDDVLNETSTAEVLGKAAGSDRSRNKATYPRQHGLEGSRREAKTLVEVALLRLDGYSLLTARLRALARLAVERPR